MKINKNDPKLTAYVLNELPASEMKWIAEEIKNNPELQDEVARLQGNSLLFKKLKTSETVRLSPAQREKIFAQTQSPSLWSKYIKLAGGLAVASLAVVIFVKNESELKSSAKKPLNSDADIAMSAPAEIAQAKRKASAPEGSVHALPAVPAQQEAAVAQPTNNILDTGNVTATEASAIAAQDAVTPDKPQEQIYAAASPSDARLGGGGGGGGPGPAQGFANEPQKLRETKEEVPAQQPIVADAEKKLNLATEGKRASFDADRFAKSAGAAVSGIGSIAGGGAPGASAPAPVVAKSSARAKLFTSTKQGAALNKSMHESPKETDQVPLETDRYSFQLINLSGTNDSVSRAISPALFSCFQNSLLKYSKYNLELMLSWQAYDSMISGYSSSTEKIEGPQDFNNEISCLKPKLTEVFISNLELNRVRKNLKFRLILRSK